MKGSCATDEPIRIGAAHMTRADNTMDIGGQHARRTDGDVIECADG